MQSDFFLSVVSLAQEDLIKRSPRGRKVAGVLKRFGRHGWRWHCKGIVDFDGPCEPVYINYYLLPKLPYGLLFITCELVGLLILLFTCFIIPRVQEEESSLYFQLLADRMLKAMIQKIAEDKSESVSRSLTMTKSNGIRYMAGYIASKLLKKNRKRNSNQKVQFKRGLFVCVLKGIS